MGLAILVVLSLYVFNEYLNRTPIVRHQKIYIEDLPASFEGFTILQFGDLHGEQFGESQKRLTEVINLQTFDMVAITGDMVNRHYRDLTPFIEILNGIRADVPIFFVKGNIETDEEVEAIRLLELEMLEEPYVFKRGNDELIIKHYEFNKELDPHLKSKTVIGLGHEPLPQDLGYDLILVGHYHGGQIRIPGYGAIFIPNIDGRQWFPKQSEVRGLQQFNGYSQYITAGLGASSSLRWLEKRWFNPPEINVITLTSFDES